MTESSNVVVIIEPILAPPVSVFAGAIREKLTRLNYACRFEPPARRVTEFEFSTMKDLVRHTLTTLERVSVPSGGFAGYVLPSVIEVVSPEQEYVCDSHIVFFSLRSDRGNEWLYPRCFNEGQSGTTMKEEISNAVAYILAERQTLRRDPILTEFESAQRIIRHMEIGVEAVLRAGVHPAPPQAM